MGRASINGRAVDWIPVRASGLERPAYPNDPLTSGPVCRCLSGAGVIKRICPRSLGGIELCSLILLHPAEVGDCANRSLRFGGARADCRGT